MTPKQRSDREEFNTILQLEKTHYQWKKQTINFSIFVALVILNLYRGSKVNPSVFGIKTCSVLDWVGICIYMTLCLGVTAYSVEQQRYE